MLEDEIVDLNTRIRVLESMLSIHLDVTEEIRNTDQWKIVYLYHSGQIDSLKWVRDILATKYQRRKETDPLGE